MTDNNQEMPDDWWPEILIRMGPRGAGKFVECIISGEELSQARDPQVILNAWLDKVRRNAWLEEQKAKRMRKAGLR